VDLFVEDCTGLDADVLFNNLPPGLERLNCQQIVKRDQSLKVLAFACPKLTWLSLRGGAISDFGFKMLTSNPPCPLAHLVRPPTADLTGPHSNSSLPSSSSSARG
jgi:hypothetical protein